MKQRINTRARTQQRRPEGAKGRFFAAIIGCALLSIGSGAAEAANKSKVSVYQHGKPVASLPCETNPGTLPRTNPLLSRTAVLMGGGLDVKDAFSWMIAKMAQCADGSVGVPGNFVVIRAGGNPSYDSFIAKLGPVASVVTLVVPNRETALDPANVAVFATYIQNAGAIWLTGGDQGDYYTYWKGTPLESLLSDQAKRFGIPIGGTSAGMMILSQLNYVAIPVSVESADALLDPYKAWQPPQEAPLDLVMDFWSNQQPPFSPLLSTVTDSHFHNRDRMGRLISFLGRSIVEGKVDSANARAIGVDQETALLMECEDYSCLNTPVLKVIDNPKTSGAAYILKATPNSKFIVEQATPLTLSNVEVQKQQVGGNPMTYEITVNAGVMTSTNVNGSIY